MPEYGSTEAMICAFRVYQGRGEPLSWSDVDQPAATATDAAEEYTWIHLDRSYDDTDRWLRESSGLDPLVFEALLEEETRPRTWGNDRGLLLILRGVNLNPGADPEDMVSVRVWVEKQRIITVRRTPLMALQGVRALIDQGKAPKNSGDFLNQLIGGLVDRMVPVIEELDDTADGLEEELLTRENHEIRASLRVLRRQAIALRRYLAPQREALSRVITEEQLWFTTRHKARLREVVDRVTRFIEELDSVRERAAVIQDELMNRLSEQMNRTMYTLSVVAAVMLPLGVITGLLGINVGGIPGAESPLGFAVVCGLLLGVVGLQIWIFKLLRWI